MKGGLCFDFEDAASCRAVHRPRKTAVMTLQDLRRAVALVDVEVDDQHPRLRVDARVQGRHREVVVKSVARAVRAMRVVRAAPEVAGEAVLEGQVSRAQRAGDFQPCTSHQ